MPLITVPDDFVCPLTNKVMTDPVSLSDGKVYENSAIRHWLLTHNESPITKEKLTSTSVTPSAWLANRIKGFLEKSKICTLENFFEGVRFGSVTELEKLRYLKQYLNEKDSITGETTLHIAAKSGNTDMVLYLLERNADPKILNKHGETALHIATDHGRTEIVQLFGMQGADVNVADSFGATAIHVAASRGHSAIVKYLIGEGADIRLENNFGFTALHSAAQAGKIETAKMLLEAGMLVDTKNTRAPPPLFLACRGGHVDCVKFLLERGAALGAKDQEGNTPLHATCKQGQQAVAAILLEWGSNPYYPNDNKKSSVDIAREHDFQDLVKFLDSYYSQLMSERARAPVLIRSLRDTLDMQNGSIKRLEQQLQEQQQQIQHLNALVSKLMFKS